jgi:hypothetical protein
MWSNVTGPCTCIHVSFLLFYHVILFNMWFHFITLLYTITITILTPLHYTTTISHSPPALNQRPNCPLHLSICPPSNSIGPLLPCLVSCIVSCFCHPSPISPIGQKSCPFSSSKSMHVLSLSCLLRVLATVHSSLSQVAQISRNTAIILSPQLFYSCPSKCITDCQIHAQVYKCPKWTQNSTFNQSVSQSVSSLVSSTKAYIPLLLWIESHDHYSLTLHVCTYPCICLCHCIVHYSYLFPMYGLTDWLIDWLIN